MIKKILALTGLFIAFIILQYAWGGFEPQKTGITGKEIVAHRGVHLNYRKGGYDLATGCEAGHIFKPSHPYIENTIESIGAAFAYGATIVEIDIRKTKDKNLVIFHDTALECRTDGEGLIAEHTTDYLKSLDIGYGYTYDNGKTFPFRGKGTGKMPDFLEVMKAYPGKKFLLDHKDGDIESTDILIKILKASPAIKTENLYYWGREDTLAHLQTEFPEIKMLLLNRPQHKKYLLPFILTFGLSGFPDALKGSSVGFPAEYIKYFWGWPYRFINSVQNQGLGVYLYVDAARDARKYRDLPLNGFITEYIEITGKELK